MRWEDQRFLMHVAGSLPDLLDELERLRKDRDRLNKLQEQEGCVRGTDISKWSVVAPDESVRDVRAAIDAMPTASGGAR